MGANIQCTCQHCEASFVAKPKLLGRRLECPGCKQSTWVFDSERTIVRLVTSSGTDMFIDSVKLIDSLARSLLAKAEFDNESSETVNVSKLIEASTRRKELWNRSYWCKLSEIENIDQPNPDHWIVRTYDRDDTVFVAVGEFDFVQFMTLEGREVAIRWSSVEQYELFRSMGPVEVIRDNAESDLAELGLD